MLLYIMISLIPALGILALILKQVPGGPLNSWIQFYAKGKKAGFSHKETSTLRNIAIHSEFADQLSLFQDPELLSQCIRTLVLTMEATGNPDPAKQNFLNRLYEYRKKIGLESGPDQKISSSRQISEGQNVRIVMDNSVMYYSRVIRSSYQYLLITRPTNPKVNISPSWSGQKLSIYFWREGDAGYVFDCEVLDEVYIKGIAAIQVSHSDSLFRTQKRKSIRAKIRKTAFLYVLKTHKASTKLEAEPGLKCIVEDLSDTGCAVTIGGKASRGMRVKLQFKLNRTILSMSGIVRSVEFNEETKRSLLHIEADPLQEEVKNAIFSEVFGILPKDEDFISFHLAEQEIRKQGH